jgi:hypothetical protein
MSRWPHQHIDHRLASLITYHHALNALPNGKSDAFIQTKGSRDNHLL